MQTLYPNYGRSAHARILPKAVLILLSLIAIKFSVSGQTCTGPMSGTYTVGSGSSCPDYATIAAVIADLNSRGVGGNVIVNIPAGYTETAPDTGFQLTFCTLPDAVKPNTFQTLTFQKSGAGTNPLITAPLWASAGPNDAIFLFTSVDYLTIDGIDLQENSGNTTNFTDFGFAFVKCDGTDGNNNNTIKYCTVSLNTANSSSACIHFGNHNSTSSSNLAYTGGSTQADTLKFLSSNNHIYGCNLSQAVFGVEMRGASTAVFYDRNNFVGLNGQSVNFIHNYGGSVTSYGTYFIYQDGAHFENNWVNSGIGGTSTLYGVFHSTGSNASINHNTVTITGGGTSSSIYGINCSASGNFVSIDNNFVTNCSYPTATSGAFYGIYMTGSPTLFLDSANTVSNNTKAGTSGTTYWFYVGAAAARVVDNEIMNNDRTAAAGSVYMFYCTGNTSLYAARNKVHDNTASSTSGSSSTIFYVFYVTGSTVSDTIIDNEIYNISISGSTTSTANTIYCFYNTSSSASSKYVHNNLIHDVSRAPAIGGTIYGMYNSSGSNVEWSKNKVYNISAGGSTGITYGGYVSSGTISLYNNYFGDLSADVSTNANGITGLYLSSGSITAANNTIYLGPVAGGSAAFGTSGIYAATGATVLLQNNIVSNHSLAGTGGSGATGVVAAYRRSTSTLTSFDNASNNNIYFAGTPDANQLIYCEGTTTVTNAKQTMPDYKAYVGPVRETNSGSENTPFLSVTGSDPTYLHIDPSLPTLAEGGAIPLAEVTDDYDGDPRDPSAPDIGADEGNFTSAAMIIAGTSISPGAQCTATLHIVTAEVTPGVNPISWVYLYYSYGGGPVDSSLMTNTGGNFWSDTIPAASPGDEVVDWYVKTTDGTYTRTSPADTYQDEYLNGVGIQMTATPNPICLGDSLHLSAIVGAPGTADIGTNTSTYSTTGNPLRTSAGTNYQIHTQMLILASELSASGFAPGNITSLGLYTTAAAGVMGSWTIGIRSTTDMSFTSTTWDTGFATVYGPGANFTPAIGLNNFVFDTPFYWDGVSNIIIETCGIIVTVGTTTTAVDNPGFTANRNLGTTTACSSATGTNFPNRPVIQLGGIIGPAGFTYAWTASPSGHGLLNSSGEDVTALPTVDGIYIYHVTATDGNGCSVSDSISVNVNPLPTAPTATNSTQCGFGVPAASVSGSGGSFNWYLTASGGTAIPGEIGTSLSNYIIGTSTNFYVSEFDGNCESPRTLVQVTVNNPDSVTATLSQSSVCPGTQVTLNYTQAGSTNTYSTVWTAVPEPGSGITDSISGSPSNITPTASGTYSYILKAVDAALSCTTYDTVTISVTDPPEILSSVASLSTICDGQSTTLTAVTTDNETGDVVVNSSGTTTTTTSYQFFAPFYEGGKRQWLYTSSELTGAGMTAGPISGLKINVIATTATLAWPNFRVSMKNTSTSSLASAWETGLTTVYGPLTQPAPSAGLNTITFSTPFMWDGVSNIVVDVCFDNDPTGTCTGGSGVCFNPSGSVSSQYNSVTGGFRYYQADNSSGTRDICDAPASAGTSSTLRSNITFIATMVGTGPGSYSWEWNPGALSGNEVTVSPSVSTIYTVTATDTSTGCTTTDTVSVIVNPAPTAPSATNSTQCGQAVPTCSVSGSGGSFNWYLVPSGGSAIAGETGTSLVSYSISSTTIFYVSEFDGNCESPRTAVTASVNPPDPVDATTSQDTLCPNATISLNAVQSGSTNTYAYEWTASPETGSGMSGTVSGSPYSVTPTAAGSYTYYLTANDTVLGCITSDSVSVVVVSPPNTPVPTAVPATVCAGDSVQLHANSYTSGSGTVTTPLLSGNGSQTNFFDISNISAVDITIHYFAAQVASGTVANLYYKTSPLVSCTTSPVIGDFTQIGFNIAITPNGDIPNPLTPIPLDVNITIPAGTTYSFVVDITGGSLKYSNGSGGCPVVASDANIAIHEGFGGTTSSAIASRIFNGSVSYTYLVGDPNLVYNWQPSVSVGDPAVQDPMAAPSSTTDYTVTVTNVGGCSASGTVTVNVNPLPATPSATNSTQCGYGIPACSVSGSGGSFVWYDVPTGGTAIPGETGSSLTSYAIGATTVFYVSEFDGNCESQRVAVTANVSPPDSVVISTSADTLCLGSSLTLIATNVDGHYPYNYTWTANPAANSGIPDSLTGDTINITPLDTGSFEYMVVAENTGLSCAFSTSRTVYVNPLPQIVNVTASPDTLCFGNSADLHANAVVGIPVEASLGSGVTNQTSSAYQFFPTFYEGSKRQWLFTATELTAAGLNPGPITGIKVDLTAATATLPLNGYSISMKNTSTASLASAWETGLTTVYGPTIQPPPVLGINLITFNTSFFWDGVSNVVVQVCYDNDPNGTCTGGSGVCFNPTGSVATHYTSVTGGYRYYQADNSSGVRDICGSPAGAGTSSTIRSNMIFVSVTDVTGTMNWNWEPGSLSGSDVTVTPPLGTTTYTVTATDPAGCSSSATIDVTALSAPPAPVVTAANDSICQSGSTILSYANAVGGSTIQWQLSADTTSGWTNTGTGTDTLQTGTITTTTWYRVLSNCSGLDSSWAMAVTVLKPEIDSVQSATRCGEGPVTINAYGNGTFQWFTASSGGTALFTGNPYMPLVSGSQTFWVQAAIGSCISLGGRLPATVTVNAAPAVTYTVTPDDTLCIGPSVTMTAASINDPNYTYYWSVDGVTPVFTGNPYTDTPVTDTLYYLYAVDSTNLSPYYGCANLVNIPIKVNPIPVQPIISPAGATLCNIGDSVTLNVSNAQLNLPGIAQIGTSTTTSSSQPNPYYTTWYGNKNQYLILASELTAAGVSAGNITSLGLDLRGATTTLTLTNFTISMGQTAAVAMTPGTWMTGLTQVYSVASYDVAANQNTITNHSFSTPFTWDGTSNIIIETCFNNTAWNGSQTIAYSTTPFVSAVYYDADLSTVCTSAAPDASASRRPNFYLGALIGSGVIYTWNPGGYIGSTYTVTPIATTDYTVTASFPTGCSSSDIATVTYAPLTPPVITPSGATTFCEGGTVDLDAGAGYSSYEWSDGNSVIGTSQVLSVTPASTTDYTVTVSNGTCSASSTQTVTVYPNPAVNIQSSSTSFCTGGNLLLTAAPSFPGYLWSTTETTQSITVNTSGTYSVTVTDANSCTGTASVTITEVSPPPAPVVTPGGNQTLCWDGVSTTTFFHLDVDTTGAGAGATIVWNGDIFLSNGNSLDVDPNFYGYGVFPFSVTVTNAGGCGTTSDTVYITIDPCSGTTLNLTMFIQGYYAGSGFMNAALYNSSVSGSGPNDCDTVHVCLMDTGTFAEVECADGILQTNGTVTLGFTNSGAYYVKVTQRNALQTWSAVPVTLSGSPASYDFSSGSAQAYGGNQVAVDVGVFGFWSGDVNQDELVESTDYSQVENDATAFLFGYYSSDVTGDGLVESADYSLVENNSGLFLFSVHP